ncbi:MAG: cytidyltransferase [Bacteroidales bacterium]|nr:MAG: cytidyltransferase [Bacteroidales bacterium]
MKSVAIIPLRKGSKGIPGKNKKKILGRPLYQWCLGEAILSDLDEIYVFTDDNEIIENIKQEYTWTSKVKTLNRSTESALDTASTEEAMLEFSRKINNEFDVICLLQATSPLTSKEDINKTLAKVTQENYDSALTVVNTTRFIWNKKGESLNYDFMNRPRRQDFDGLQIENGAVYVSTKKQFLTSKNRLGGKIAIVEMPEDTLIEIDETSDFVIIENLIKNRLQTYKKCPSRIELLVLDVDGVFTDGTVNVSANGELSKSFSLRDGMGLELVRNSGVEVVVMTSENSDIVEKRMGKLGISNLFMGVKDKFSRLNNFLIEKNLKRNSVAYIGDDINDLVNLCSVSWGFCPNNAVPEVKLNSDFILNNNGGDMAIREAVEFIIKYNQRFIK